jgi:tetratricopeptide (TPR) repeat protein
VKRRTEIVLLAAILAVAAGLRCAFLAERAAQPEFHHPLLDDLYHDYWARSLAFDTCDLPPGVADPQISSTPWFRPPGYPLFLAAVYRLTGPSPWGPRAVQTALGVLACFLTWRLARRLTSQAWPALLAAALTAISWPLIYYESTLHAPVLLVLLALLGLHALARFAGDRRPVHVVSAGLAFGGFALVRPDVLPFVAAAAAWIVWRTVRTGPRLRRALVCGAAFLLSVSAMLLPVAVRNRVAGGEWVLVSANGGINLFFGNNPLSDGVSASHPDVGAWSCFDYPRIVRDLAHRAGRPVSYVEADRQFARRAREFIREHPGRAISSVGRKLLLLWSNQEIASENNVEYECRQSHVLRFLCLPFALLMTLALAGAGLYLVDGLRARHRDSPGLSPSALAPTLTGAAPLALFVAIYSLTQAAFIVCGRYRAPMLPLLHVAAAYGIWRLVRLMRAARADQIVAGGFMALCLLALVASNPARHRPRPWAGPLHRALASAQAGRIDEAVGILQAIAAEGEANAETHAVLGNLLARAGRSTEAERALRRALTIDPDLLDARVRLGQLAASQGRLEEAAGEFRAALSRSPSMAEAHGCLGVALALLGRPDEAVPHLREGLRGRDNRDALYFALAGILLRRGGVAAAGENFDRGLAVCPTNAAAWLHVGREWLDAGHAGRAVPCLERAATLDPDSAAVHQALAEARRARTAAAADPPPT